MLRTVLMLMRPPVTGRREPWRAVTVAAALAVTTAFVARRHHRDHRDRAALIRALAEASSQPAGSVPRAQILPAELKAPAQARPGFPPAGR